MGLPGEVLDQLHATVIAAFTSDELGQVCQFQINTRLDQLVSLAKNLSAIVFGLLAWLERNPDQWPAFPDGLERSSSRPDFVAAIEQVRQHLNPADKIRAQRPASFSGRCGGTPTRFRRASHWGP
jgi:hypothetical protein